ncbi:MAG: phosphoenolpyruvate--protein phosphotransferase [Anaerobiospirillum succiniciproducens]|uniref:phosphoenolpyruvate--protein phosphotransferase n=1 Tax=Anaerobiospirillum succiniciproducens TaxID=13335 RepID=UPI0026DBA27A|nr:phosphoenolpyruvate--protein phosphotransferase [Anaerobiospirillum succiniciproducens]MDO4676947.1 phosphoenolpyruvate--protein phosphotransferase [Anaerobiospirillum succiniciproducens]
MYTGKGRCACAGITFGKVLHIKTPEVVASDRDCLSVDQELELFEGALSKAATELDRLIEKAREEIGDEQAEIFEIHRMMLEDPDICDNIRDRIKKGGINAADAAVSVGKEQAADFEALDDPYMRERAADVKDVTGRIARILRGGETVELTEACVIVADDLQPSQTVALDRSLILGFVLRQGTQNSHASILARTMNIPLIINSNLPSSLDGDGKAATESEEAMDLTGHTIGLDAVKGEFFIDPDQSTITKLMAAKDAFEQQRIRQLALRGQPGISKTGHRVYTFANIGQPDDVEQVLENDGEGIGLFRSEFLYLGRSDPPSEEEQFKAYAKVASAMNGRLVIIRTLDIGADKQVDYFDLPHEENPALGLRALRICLTKPEIFKTQLRAIYRAAARGNIAMMFPMVTRLKEIEQAKAICAEVVAELKSENIEYGEPKIGIMIETPAAAVLSRQLAEHVDFFSVGTNDLNQYTTACDRQNQNLGDFYDPHHEAVLELLRQIASNAHAAGITAGICGELAADPELTDKFIEMGYDELSVSPGAVLALRERVRNSEAVCLSSLKNPKISLDPVKKIHS